MSNISTCSNLYYTDENGKEHSFLKLYAYGKCVWKKEETGVWIYVVSVSAGQEVKIDMYLEERDTIDWGDGFVSVCRPATHIYEKSGVYTITCTDIKKQNVYYGRNVYPATCLQKIIHPKYCTEIYIAADSDGNYVGNISVEYSMPTKITKCSAVLSGIVNMDIPVGVTEIVRKAFVETKKLEKITLPKTLKSIGNYAFQNLTALNDISFPESLANIGQYAFSGTNALKTVTLPKDVELGYGCFSSSGLEHITFSMGFNSVVGWTCSGCSNLEEIILPDSVTFIGESAFYGTKNVKSIIFSDNITSIGQRSFYSCGSMSKSIKNLILPKKTTTIGKYAFYNFGDLETLTLNDILEYIGDYAFYGCCDKVSKINFPDTLETIGSFAFTGNKFETISIPTKTTSIGDYAFSGCRNLISLTIGEKNTDSSYIKIGRYCFNEAIKLKSITINRPISTIGEYAFSHTSSGNLVTLTFNASVNVIGSRAFEYVQIEEILFPTNLRVINARAFEDNNALKVLSFPNTLRTIGEYSFYGNWSLEEIDIPASVTSIEDKAFVCNNVNGSPMKKIIIRGNPTIGKYALGFYNDTHRSNCTFYGIAGSHTETYAKENGFDFVAI